MSTPQPTPTSRSVWRDFSPSELANHEQLLAMLDRDLETLEKAYRGFFTPTSLRHAILGGHSRRGQVLADETE